jgi:dienelactone hydrolase
VSGTGDARWWAMRPAQSSKPATYRCPLCGRSLHAMSAHTLIAPEGDAERRRHAHTECVLAARRAGTLPTYDDWRATQPRPRGLVARFLAWLSAALLLAGCGSSGQARPPRAQEPTLLTFAYDKAQPLGFVDRGRINPRAERVAIDDVSFRSSGRVVEGYLLVPSGHGRRPAVVFVHGSGGDRNELLEHAKRLAKRGVVALTITEPSTSAPPARARTVAGTLRRLEEGQVRDVVAIRRAVDVLQSRPEVDRGRIGYLGWSAGARAGTFVAASEPRVKALALLSGGAAPVSTYVANAPPGVRRLVRTTLTRIDPIRYVAHARPGTLLLEDGRRDEIVPRTALENIVRAAPAGTKVRWYAAPHALGAAAYRNAFAWFEEKLG